MIHFEGTFTGYYSTSTSLSSLGIYEFKKIKWEFLDINIERKLSERKLKEEKVLDFWYCRHLYSGKNKNPLVSPKCEINLRLPGIGKYNPDLFNVIITGYTGERVREHFPIRKIEPGISIGYGAWETKGKIRFSIPDPTPPPPPAATTPLITEKTLEIGPRTQSVAGDSIVVQPVVTDTSGAIADSTVIIGDANTVNPTPAAVPAKNGGCLGNSVIGLIGVSLLFYQPWLGILILGWMLSRVSRNNLVIPTGASPVPSTARPRLSFWSILMLAITA